MKTYQSKRKNVISPPGENVAPRVGHGHSGCVVTLYVHSVHGGAQLQLVYKG